MVWLESKRHKMWNSSARKSDLAHPLCYFLIKLSTERWRHFRNIGTWSRPEQQQSVKKRKKFPLSNEWWHEPLVKFHYSYTLSQTDSVWQLTHWHLHLQSTLNKQLSSQIEVSYTPLNQSTELTWTVCCFLLVKF